MVEVVNGGNNSTDLENTNQDKKKGHPHPWRDGTHLSHVCKILLLWTHRNFRKQ
jgi:hypothetical protein